MKAAAAVVAVLVAACIAVTVALPLVLIGAAVPAAGQGIDITGPSALASSEIPAFLLPHYQVAPACAGLPWQIVAAIGWVESRHGQGRVDPTTGNTTPPIIGPTLDGAGGTAAIPATPESTRYTGDPVWDHAVGPMQFLTSTFDAWAVDASGNPSPSPNNAFDAIASAGRYLCNGQPRLDSVTAAVRRYNNSDTYVADVLAKALAYGMTTAGGAPSGGGADPTVGHTVPGDVGTVIGFAVAQLGKPYVWGATGPDAYDCSGLTQAAYAAAGIQIGRTTYQQATDGIAVDWRTQPIEAGDLIFIADGESQPLGHVGLALDATHWIVAPYTGTVVQIAPIPFDAIQAVRQVTV